MSGLDHVCEAFDRWLHLPDKAPLFAVLAAVSANRLPGDPVWLLLVGPPGSGKSETLQAAAGLPEVHPTGTLTEAALLSGTAAKERAQSAKGGLLREIGASGIVLCKDVGSILSMHREARSQVLAALREVYDGSWTRHVGTEGGRTLHWQGKVGLIGGVTPTIDRHHSVMASLGERFLLLRMPPVDESEQARKAFAHAGREREMRADLAAAVEQLFETATPSAAVELQPEEIELLVSLSTFAVRCRSAVERDGYSRDIELIPPAEAPTRLIVVLRQFLTGLHAIGLGGEEAWRITRKATLDSIPAIRLEMIRTLGRGATLTTSEIVILTGYPLATAKRALEDLAAHKIVLKADQGKGKASLWTISDWTRDKLAAIGETYPEKSEHTQNGGCPEMSEEVLSLFQNKNRLIGLGSSPEKSVVGAGA